MRLFPPPRCLQNKQRTQHLFLLALHFENGLWTYKQTTKKKNENHFIIFLKINVKWIRTTTAVPVKVEIFFQGIIQQLK